MSDEVEFKPVKVDTDTWRAWHGENELTLTRLEFRLLARLVQSQGNVVSHEALLRDVWGSEWTSRKTLQMHISWLRKKLGDNAEDSKYITSIRGVGFRLEKAPDSAKKFMPPADKESTLNTVYVCIGNSDDKLTQQEWSLFCEEVKTDIQMLGAQIHGVWFSAPDSQYQNMCIAFQPTRGWVEQLKENLRVTARRYKQDSIAWQSGPTEFLK